MEEKINMFLAQLNSKIEVTEKELKDAKEELKDRVDTESWYFIDSRQIEKIKTFEKVLEELKYQKNAFEYLFIKNL